MNINISVYRQELSQETTKISSIQEAVETADPNDEVIDDIVGDIENEKAIAMDIDDKVKYLRFLPIIYLFIFNII